MNKAKIFIEGQPDPLVSEIKLENQFQGFGPVQAARFTLSSAFSQLFQQEITDLNNRFLLHLSGGWQAALKAYLLELKVSSNPVLLIDFKDVQSENKEADVNENLANKVKEYIETEPNLIHLIRYSNDYLPLVFFMKQKMEAWFLSQPDAIRKSFQGDEFNQKQWEKILERLGKKKPFEILSPDTEVENLVHCFKEHQKGGKKKMRSYGKVKTAYQFLTKLSLKSLMQDFEDVKRLIEHLKQLNSPSPQS